MKKNTLTLNHIVIKLSGGKTADFYYSDLTMAQAHYQTIKAAGQLGGVWITTCELIPATNPHLIA
jgi:hypothetical protein